MRQKYITISAGTFLQSRSKKTLSLNVTKCSDTVKTMIYNFSIEKFHKETYKKYTRTGNKFVLRLAIIWLRSLIWEKINEFIRKVQNVSRKNGQRL